MRWTLLARALLAALAAAGCGARTGNLDTADVGGGSDAASAGVVPVADAGAGSYAIPCTDPGALPCGSLQGVDGGYYELSFVSDDGGSATCSCVPESVSPQCAEPGTYACHCDVCGPDIYLDTTDCEYNAYNGLPITIACRQN